MRSEPGICNPARLELSKHTSLSTVNTPGATSKQALLSAGVKVVCSSLGRKWSFPEYLAAGNIAGYYKTRFC